MTSNTSAPASSLPLFYQQPKVLQPGLHGGKSLSVTSTYRFAAETNAVPLVASELEAAARSFPVVFSDGPNPRPMAVLGLRASQNIFIDAEGRWRDGVYVPAYIRRYPFIFLENEAGTELTLCIDEAAPHVVDGGEQPFFDSEGKPTSLTQGALEFCRDYQAQHLATTELGNAMAEADLLVDNRADVTLNNGETMSLSGFKVVDAERLKAMPPDLLMHWLGKGWLQLVFAHFFSLNTWEMLIDGGAPSAPDAD